MGFYGNITNTSRTTFQFDKIYSSRYDMDGKSTSDGVFNGRYVLIEYDSELDQEYFKTKYVLVGAEGQNQNYKLYRSLKAQYNPNAKAAEISADPMFVYARSSTDSDFYNYFNGVIGATALQVAETQGLGLLYFDIGQVYNILNYDRMEFVAFNNTGNYRELSFNDFIALCKSRDPANTIFYEAEGLSEENFRQHDEAYFSAQGNIFTLGYIANGLCRPADMENYSYFDPAFEFPAVILPGRRYVYNAEPQLWRVSNLTYQEESTNTQGQITYIEYSKIVAIPSYNDNYSQNFNLDKEYYQTTRGYDSTVWQKVFVDGAEKYVMVAELNTVVPTFGITADPPTLLPLNPHWGVDSTNVYYDLHWQPQWGFRIKSASSTLTLPIIDPSGVTIEDDQYVGTSSGRSPLRDIAKDSINYPSDVNITYAHTFEDLSRTDTDRTTLYYDANQGIWNNNRGLKFPGAIYFNKDGFDSDVIAYSDDLITENIDYNRFVRKIAESGWTPQDTISITPTGYSGNIYNQHNGMYNKKAQVDTQELSIMLPGIGDMISQVWDLIYGGRDTSATIAKTNHRNKNIEWENGTVYLNRLGLRLRGTDGKSYNKKAVETLAGCINTAHDLFGMIIQRFDHYNDLNTMVKALDFNHIYYAEDQSKYYRKHITYDYTPLQDDDYIWNPVNTDLEYLDTEKIQNGNYWIEEPVGSGTYINVQDIDPMPEYDPTVTYYYRSVEPVYTELVLEPGQIFSSFPYQNYYWFEDQNGDILNNDPYKSNYIRDPNYQEGKKYYRVTISNPVNLEGNYIKNHYYYFDKGEYASGNIYGNLLLDTSDEPHRYIPAKHNKEDFANNPDKIYNGRFYVYDMNEGMYRLCVPSKDTYDPSITYYYKNNYGFYEVDAAQMHMDLTAYGFEGIYAPGQWYYLNDAGDYVIDNSINGANIASNLNVDYDAESGIHYCYQSMAAREGYEPGTPITIYVLKHHFEVANYVNEYNYSKNSYYLDLHPEDEAAHLSPSYYTNVDNFILSTDNYSNSATYYIDNKSYELQEIDENAQIIDPETRTSFEGLLKFREDTYYRKVVDPDDPMRVTKFENIGLEWIQERGAFIRDENVYVLGLYPDESEEQEFENFEWSNKGDGILYLSMADKIALDRYKTDPNSPAYDAEYEPFIIQADDFYIKNEYHYEVDGSYILDRRDYKTEELNYYKILNIEEAPDIVYLETDDYFYYDSNEYIPITPENIDNINGAYVKDAIYVYSDNRQDTDEQLQLGMEWNIDALTIPNKITLAKRSKRYELQELKNYAIDKSTINGLLLDSYNLMEFKDTLTRDKTKVTGSLNKINDILARFNKMKSRQLTLIDDAGRVHSAPVYTRQNESIQYNNPGTDTYYTYTSGDKYPEVASTTNMRQQWITVNLDGDMDNPSITIHHNFQHVTDTTSATNKNTNNVASNRDSDKLVLYTPIVDATGHVVGHNDETVTLPYGFKSIATNGVGSETDDLILPETLNNIVAENTQDVLTINSNNKWIRIAPDSLTDTLTIAHEIHEINTTALATNFNNNDVGNTFVVKDVATDIAGHFTANQNHTYTLPYNWKTIATNGSSNVVTDLTSNTTSVVANNCKDTLTINAGNAWIKFAGDDTNNTLTIAHTVNTITTTAKTDTALDGVGNFTVQDITQDEAGHITAIQSHKYNLPYNFRNISINQKSTTVTSSTGPNSTASIEADSYNDTFTLGAANAWITITGDTSNDLILFGHAAAQTATTTKGDSANQTPQFNATFKIPYIGIDNTGHVSTLTDHTVTIPTISVSTDNTGNVVTGGVFNNNGTLTLNTSQLGGLTLSATYAKASASAAIASTDTVNSAFGKVEYKVDDALNQLSNLTLSSITDLNNLTITLSQISDLNNLTITLNQISDLNNLGITLNQISDLNDLNIALDQISDLNTLGITLSQISDLNTLSITTSQISNLDNYTGFDSRYYTETEIDDAASGCIRKNTAFIYSNTANNTTFTAGELTNRVAELETAIRGLVALIPDSTIAAADKETFLDSLDIVTD